MAIIDDLRARLDDAVREALWDASWELIRAQDDLRECAAVQRTTITDHERVKAAAERWDKLKATGLNVPIGPNGVHAPAPAGVGPAKVPAERCPGCGETFHPIHPATGELCPTCRHKRGRTPTTSSVEDPAGATLPAGSGGRGHDG